MRYRHTFTEDFFGVTGEIESTREIETMPTAPTQVISPVDSSSPEEDIPMITNTTTNITSNLATVDPEVSYTIDELNELKNVWENDSSDNNYYPQVQRPLLIDPTWVAPNITIEESTDGNEGFGGGYGGGGAGMEKSEELLIDEEKPEGKKKIIWLILIAVAVYAAYRFFGSKKPQ